MSGEAWGTAEEGVFGRQTAEEEEEGRKLGEFIQSVFVRFFLFFFFEYFYRREGNVRVRNSKQQVHFAPFIFYAHWFRLILGKVLIFRLP